MLTDTQRQLNYEIVAIMGYSKVGKDYICKHVLPYLSTTFSRYGLADELKRLYCLAHRISLQDLEINKELHRPQLINFSFNGLNKNNKIFLLDNMFRETYLTRQSSLIITDVRTKEEWDYLHHEMLKRETVGSRSKLTTVYVEFPESKDVNRNCGFQLESKKDKADVVFTNTYNKESFNQQIQLLIAYIRGKFGYKMTIERNN